VGELVFGAFGGTCRNSFASGVNAVGDVVGYSTTDAGVHGFLWHGEGTRIDMGTLGGPTSWAVAVNARAEVAGVSDTDRVVSCQTNEWGTFCTYEAHAFLWRDGRMSDLGTLGGPHATARAINDRGDIVGESDTADVVYCYDEGGEHVCIHEIHAFLWRNGLMIDLGQRGEFSFATGINTSGKIVGGRGSSIALWVPDSR
jgi:probable HAF family extracellular repeat protein